MKRLTKKSCIVPRAFSWYFGKKLLQSASHGVCSALSSTYSLFTFLRSRMLNPTANSICHLTEAHSTPWQKKGWWKWQPSADPLRSTGLGPSLQHTHAAQCYQPQSSASQKLQWIRSGRLPPARFLCSQICARAADSLHTSCEISSAPWSWLSLCLAQALPVENTKQNKVLWHPWLSFLTLLLCRPSCHL